MQTELNTYGNFRSQRQAKATLEELVETHRLCAKLSGLEKGHGRCFGYQLKRCSGACIHAEDAESYNHRAIQALQSIATSSWPFNNKIILKEQSLSMDLFHVIDQWHYLGSSTHLTEAQAISKMQSDLFNDKDIKSIVMDYVQPYSDQHQQLISLVST